jgi:hypothetical protein
MVSFAEILIFSVPLVRKNPRQRGMVQGIEKLHGRNKQAVPLSLLSSFGILDGSL